MSELLTPLSTQLGMGGIGGFAVGYSLKKLAKLTAIIIGFAFDGETGYWSSYAPGAPSDLTEMVDGKGYWIKVSADVLWEIDTG